MAWTERYVRADAAGSGDGTTDTASGANGAWTLAEGVTNEAAGMRLNVKAGTYANSATTRTLAAAGTTTAPIWWRGFKTSAGDQDANNVAVAGTDIPSLTFTTGALSVTGNHHILSNLDVTGANTSSAQLSISTAQHCLYYRMRVTNTASAGLAVKHTSINHTFIACYFKAATTAAEVAFCDNGPAAWEGCTFTGGVLGMLIDAGVAISLNDCVFDSPADDAVKVSAATPLYMSHCSIYALVGHGIEFSATPLLTVISNCYFEGASQTGKVAINNSTGTNTDNIRCLANAYFNWNANTAGLGDSPLIFDNGTLASAGFVAPASQDFAMAAVGKAIGFPGTFENVSAYRGYSDVGAPQRVEPTGGGGATSFAY